MKYFLFILCFIGMFHAVCAKEKELTKKDFGLFEVDFPAYLSQHDIVYQDPDYDGFNGFPLGNGDLGGMVWCNEDGLQVQINKVDLYDKPSEDLMTLRSAGQLKIDFGTPCFNYLYLNNFESRLSLAEVEVSYKAFTGFVNTHVNTWVDAHKNMWFFDCDNTFMDQLERGAPVTVSLERWGSRVFNGWYGGFDRDVTSDLGRVCTSVKERTAILEDSLDGGLRFVVACRILGGGGKIQVSTGHKLILTKTAEMRQKCCIALTVITSEEAEDLVAESIRLLDEAEKQSISKHREEHRASWKSFWEKSFVHLDNNYMENIYYLRRYLMNCSSKGKYLSPFNGGLWVWNRDIRQWCTPHHWNTQESYWGLAAQNDCELIKPYMATYFRLIPQAERYAGVRGVKDAILWNEAHDFSGNMVGANWSNMANNFTPASQMASIFWEYFEFSQDRECLRDTIYPFMKKAAEFYLQYLKWEPQKQEYYIFPSQPYEHAANSQLKNCITDRYMIEALFKNCIKAASILRCDKKKVKAWSHVIDHLWGPPILETPNGKVFGTAFYPDGKVYPEAERYGNDEYHFGAHTTQVFPAEVLGLDQEGTEYFDIAKNVALHHPDGKNAITPGPIVAARLGLGEQVVKELSNSINRLQHFSQGLFYNLDHWYQLSPYAGKVPGADVITQRDYVYDSRVRYNVPDAGNSGLSTRPFIQCGMEPMGIYGTAINEMLLQSHEGKIRVFPAIPKHWEGAFTLLARNAFIVSSSINKEGDILGINIVSQKGNICKVQSPWKGKKIVVISKGGAVHYKQMDGVVSFRTEPGASYLLYAEGKCPHAKKSYTDSPNYQVKKFGEAILGKERTF